MLTHLKGSDHLNEARDYIMAPFSRVHRHVFSGFLLGQIASAYALSIVGTALTDAQNILPLTSFWIGLIGAGTLIGLFFSAVVGRIADSIGRQKLFRTDMILFTVLSLLQFLTTNLIILLILRIGIGIAIAIDYTVGSAMLTEWFPTKLRAKYQSTLLIFWMIGFVAAYLVGTFLTGFGTNTWKIVICSSAVPSLIAAIYRLVVDLPESPSWLAQKDYPRAVTLVQKYLGTMYTIVKPQETTQQTVSFGQLFSKELWRHTVVGGMFYACQVFPFFGIGIFLPILLKQLNLGNQTVSGVLYNSLQIVGVIIGVIIFNRITRRAFLLSTFYIAAILLLIITFWTSAPGLITLSIFSIFAIVLSAALVLENPYPPELFATEIRASGVGAAITISRIGAAGGTFLLPIITQNFGVHVTLGICAISLLLGGVICQLWAPETAPQSKRIQNLDVATTPGVQNIKENL